MKIGVPNEIKIRERRVALTPAGVAAFIENGHQVFVENDAGIGSGITNADYTKMGARIINKAEEIWSGAPFALLGEGGTKTRDASPLR